MSDGATASNAGRSILERLSQAFSTEPKNRDQLVSTLREAESRNLIDSDGLAMIEGVLQVSEMRVRDIMVPRSQMIVLEADASLEQVLPVVVESAHSRFPVIGDSRDEVEGLLLAKDLLAFTNIENAATKFDMKELLRRAVFVPESKRLNVLLTEFRNNRNHMAIVVDEYGGVAGLVTIEDVLEQIVGEITDEYDIAEEEYIKRDADNTFRVKGLTPIEDFNTYFGSEFSDEDYDTMGGLIVNGFGHMPKRGEKLTLSDIEFEVIRADKRRIQLLNVYIADIDIPGLDTSIEA
ncbi:MAG TPA: magnesium/cobalt efflux protein [Gammaproteobacteria bacterium]|nr:magnesium/cobalt efflux protein [Gammaproteobacteria bacterium]